MRRHIPVLLGILVIACAADEPSPAVQPDAAAAAAPAVPAGPALRLQDLDWLVGSWRGTGEGDEFHEDIQVVDDSTLAITYYEDASRTAVQRMRGTVELREGRIWHRYGDRRWVAVAAAPTSLSFEPVDNATNRFTWTRESADRWAAVLRYPSPDGGEVEGTYVMERIAPR